MSQTKTLNIVPDDSLKRIHLSQGDLGRTLIFKLFDGSASYSPPAGATVKIVGTKPSGVGYSVNGTFSGNTVTIVTTSAMADEYGAVMSELVVTNQSETEIFKSANFLLMIEKDPHPAGTVDGESSVVVPTLLQLQSAIGDLTQLNTIDKTSLVGAINEVSDLKNDFRNVNNALVTSDVNLIKLVDKTTGKIYGRDSSIAVNKVDNQFGSVYEPIDIVANTTYYYRNLYGYFCKIVYNDNTYEYLKSDSYAYASGNWTPSKSGKIYITSHNSASGIILFTDYAYLYSAKDDGWFLPNLLKTFTVYPIIVTDNSIVSDFNNVTKSAVYRIQLQGTAPSNLPSDLTGSWLLVAVASITGDNRQTMQFLYSYAEHRFMYQRNGYSNNATWSNWVTMDSAKPTIYVGSGQQFTRIRDGVEFAVQFKDATVVVRAGNYDLVSEFQTEINASTSTNFGVVIENGVHIIFETAANVTANYTGSDTNILNNFSPFIAGSNSGGFTLENLNISTKNTRYCVHDDLGDSDIVSFNKYINCRMVHDDTENTIKSYPQCIGGGFGNHTYVEIRNCYFKSLGSESYPNPLVSYHNSYSYQYAKSNVIISNSYFSGKGTYRTTHHGPSELVSITTINNCSLGSEPQIRHEVSGSTAPENTALFLYMNEIRND